MSGPQGIRPRLGFSPTSPHAAAGTRNEPAPSPPCATGTARAATSAAAPELEPPGSRSRSHGLRVTPYLGDSPTRLSPSSGAVVSPSVTSPAARNRRIRSRSWGATTPSPSSARLPAKNGTPSAMGPMSLMRNGTPANGPAASWASAGSNGGSARAFSAASARSSAARAASSTSAAVTSPLASSSRSPVASWRTYSLISMAVLPVVRQPLPGPPEIAIAFPAALAWVT